MTKTEAAALAARVFLRSVSYHGSVKKGKLTYYVRVVDHLSDTYEIQYLIAEAGTEIVQFRQPTNMSPLQCAYV